MRLDLPQLLRSDRPQTGDAVCVTALLEIGEPIQLGFVERDDQLAAGLVGDAVLVGELLHARLALHAELCLERAGLVVDAGVQHAAVVSALVLPRPVFLVHNGNQQLWMTSVQLASRTQPDDSCSDDDDVIGRSHRSPRIESLPSSVWSRSPLASNGHHTRRSSGSSVPVREFHHGLEYNLLLCSRSNSLLRKSFG